MYGLLTYAKGETWPHEQGEMSFEYSQNGSYGLLNQRFWVTSAEVVIIDAQTRDAKEIFPILSTPIVSTGEDPLKNIHQWLNNWFLIQ